jgi:hypothetical protein
MQGGVQRCKQVAAGKVFCCCCPLIAVCEACAKNNNAESSKIDGDAAVYPPVLDV